MNDIPFDALLEAAKTAYGHAYAPYSHFGVGAALLSKSGAIYAGCNVENSSFGLTRCAEQSAVQAMNTAGEREFSAAVVYSEASPPASPCGACRQILFEFAPEAEIVCVNHLGERLALRVSDLLPHGFRLSPLPQSGG